MLDYNLEQRGEASLYEYVYQQIRDDIVAGRIASGEHLPSKRAFASHLGISVITIENAYSQLLAEGYICSKPRRGYYACELPEARFWLRPRQSSIEIPLLRALTHMMPMGSLSNSLRSLHLPWKPHASGKVLCGRR